MESLNDGKVFKFGKIVLDRRQKADIEVSQRDEFDSY
jgi:hypothetical protein